MIYFNLEEVPDYVLVMLLLLLVGGGSELRNLPRSASSPYVDSSPTRLVKVEFEPFWSRRRLVQASGRIALEPFSIIHISIYLQGFPINIDAPGSEASSHHPSFDYCHKEALFFFFCIKTNLLERIIIME